MFFPSLLFFDRFFGSLLVSLFLYLFGFQEVKDDKKGWYLGHFGEDLLELYRFRQRAHSAEEEVLAVFDDVSSCQG